MGTICIISIEISVQHNGAKNLLIQFHIGGKNVAINVKNIFKEDNLHSISSPLQRKFKIWAGKFVVKAKHCCQQTFYFQSLLTTPSNVLPLHLKQTLPPMI